MSRPIGGYHPFELPSQGNLPYSRTDGNYGGVKTCDAFPINLGRSGLSFILQHRRYRKVWLPAYICPVVFDTLNQLGVAYETYMLDMQFAPIGHFDNIADDEAFLYVDYFGLKDATVRRLAMEQKNLIADLTMAFFCRPPAEVDAFNSARKFVGVPDGGFLFGTIAETLNQQIQKTPDSVSRQTGWSFCRHLLMRADGDVEPGYPYFRENSEAMDGWSPCRMSLLSEKILRSVTWRSVSQRRRENFLLLHEHFGNMNELNWDSVAEAMGTSDTHEEPPIPPSDVPQCYPLLLADRNVGEDWKKRLIADKIFVPTFWSKLDRYLVDFPWEQCLVRNLICLPVDQNCTRDDMRRMIAFIQERNS